MTARPRPAPPTAAYPCVRAWVAGLVLLAAVTPAWPDDSPAATPATELITPGVDEVTLNFANADIAGVARAISDVTGRNFVLDPRVQGTVHIVTTRPMSRDQVYDVFLSALRLQGFAAIEDQGMVKIVPESDGRLQSGPTLGPWDDAGTRGDEIQTRVFELKYESATQVLPILRPLIAPNNTISAAPGSNALVITDYAGNLRRIARIIASIDQPGDSEPVVIPLRHASAVDVASSVNQLFGEPALTQAGIAPEPVQRFTAIADGRSNSLLVRAGDPARLSRVRKFVALLDSPTGTDGNIHVVHLKNAEAVKLAETLRAIYQGNTDATARTDATALPVDAPDSMLLADSFATGESRQVPAGIIQADAATNSIIITAADAVYNTLRAALDKLDVRRAQVYVEALIAEVTADKAGEFGIQWQDLSGLDETSTEAFGGTNFGGAGQNIIGISGNPASAGRGLNIGIVAGRVLLPGLGEILNLGVLVRALQSDANANILSTPTLLTLDNEEAAIVIGQNVPFITGQYALSGAATTPTPFQTVERRDVGLTLRVKPQISEGGTVRLQLYQEVSSVQDTSNPAGVITNKRAVGSTILVDDGQIIAIGGLIQDTVSDGVQKVPLLGDVPLLGNLFRYRTRSHSKTNLMIFLRPTVVRNAGGADALTSRRYDYIIGEQARARPLPSPVLPHVEAPVLEPRVPPAAVPGAPTPDR